MWERSKSDPGPVTKPPPATRPGPPAPTRRTTAVTVTATIGSSISVKGEISGSEDLLIEGQVDGAIQLHDSDVTVGSTGRVTANIHAKRIYVDGEVTGDLLGDEVLIRESGRVVGDATAPRVTLESGCRFRGSIDMKPHTDGPKAGPPPQVSPDQPERALLAPTGAS